MRFTFKFLLTNNRVERHTFTSINFNLALSAAQAYCATAFAAGEVLDFFWEA